MRAIAEMLKPRESVFSDTERGDVLNLSDFAEGRVDAEKFFAENFRTQGMSMLFDTAFKRFRGQSDTGVIKLTQAMGGGKTHSMLALALLSDNEELRVRILGKEYAGIGHIKVVSFSGRENADFGIWGSIAEQLGKRDVFSEYYAPLKAPGESAWINLLKNDKILILLDELPPYLENARSITVGNSDLSKVTMTALANLFSALGKAQLANVCLVFSDLRATYESGSALLQSSFKELEAEASRIAIEIAPVAQNSDEVYSILRKRLFEDSPVCSDFVVEKNEIALSFKDAVATAKKMGFTAYTGEAVFKGIIESYPFHPSIKELYARFKENQNFQQTRGLIKLMRQIVRKFYERGDAQRASLINVFDVDLNLPLLMSLFIQIKPSLENAISHDIAQNGASVAELIDTDRPEDAGYAQQIAKLLLVSSLSTANHALLGLTEPEILGFLCGPGVDLNALKACLEELKSLCWYIKTDNRGRLYFQNTKNMIAEMHTLVDSYTNENARKELRAILEDTFKVRLKTCYEGLFVLPAVDEIHLDSKKVSLIIFEPHPGGALHPDLQAFYDNSSLKNRMMFLSGDRSMMERLYENSKLLRAAKAIVQGLRDERVSETDQQFKEATDQLDRAWQTLLSTIRETFTRLYYPDKNGLTSVDFSLNIIINNNHYDGEGQIIQSLTDVSKYEPFSAEESALEALRKKCERRLFTRDGMRFSEILDRAASETIWQWLHPQQMDMLKDYCTNRDKWREIGGVMMKGPFEKAPTSVTVSQTDDYDFENHQFTLKVKGVGGRVYWDIGSDPTTASSEFTGSVFQTKEPCLRFICIDPTGERKTGNVVEFLGIPEIRYKDRLTPNGRAITLVTHPRYELRYTTDGSEPKENGGIYTGEFILPKDCRFVQVAAIFDGQAVISKSFAFSPDSSVSSVGDKPNVVKPLRYHMHTLRQMPDTQSSYDEFSLLEKLEGVTISGAVVTICDKNNMSQYVEYTASIPMRPGDLRALVDLARETSFSGIETTVIFEYQELQFPNGQGFYDWAELGKLDLAQLLAEGEVSQ